MMMRGSSCAGSRSIPWRTPRSRRCSRARDSGMQFSHSLDDLLGGMLRAGLQIRDLFEDTNGEGRLHELGVTSMIAVRAEKPPLRVSRLRQPTFL